ncbi:hypothetical protein BT69DRAFT_1347207 [Atractiella rhizophila]|nr:hypothetical protein BT69DRAFT_1358547 [Atractiella rhizophila]KAH8927518.1 hypothetical protein BT69DRAFT_1347207 [Atractiella rhizophila]
MPSREDATKSGGYAFVTFRNVTDALRARDALNGTLIGEPKEKARVMTVEVAVRRS